MIRVLCDPSERVWFEELFELFKTPWCFDDARGGAGALIVSGARAGEATGPVIVAFGSGRSPLDERLGVTVGTPIAGATIVTDAGEVPIAGPVATLAGPGDVRARVFGSGECIGLEIETGDAVVLRLGYDLAGELALLLGPGQSPQTAPSPSLELQIDVLRRFLTRSLGLLAEIPPVRNGHPFAVCLTHDIDFHSIRSHRLDRTLLGFMWRASVGSLRDVVSGRGTIRRLARNLRAVASLPLVFARVLPDVWSPFADYERADGTHSTFFVIPFRDTGGGGLPPERSRRRAVKYDVDDVAPELRRLTASGFEVAVHGIDAWRDVEAGRRERRRVGAASGVPTAGVRMHWLCQDERTAATVEAAGYDYDATAGYNDAVGFLAGTTQVYRPAGANGLLELPLHVQDTALFFPGRQHLRESEAWQAVSSVLAAAQRFGGVVTISWHDRSLAPERLWDSFYARLLAAARAERAWFGTARELVDWFRLRRRVSIVRVDREGDGVTVALANPDGLDVEAAGLVVRLHVAHGGELETVDLPWSGAATVEHALAGPGDGKERPCR